MDFCNPTYPVHVAKQQQQQQQRQQQQQQPPKNNFEKYIHALVLLVSSSTHCSHFKVKIMFFVLTAQHNILL